MQSEGRAFMPSLFAYLVRAVAHSFPVVAFFAVLMVGLASLNADGGSNSTMLITLLFFYGALFQVLLLRPRRFWSRTWETDDGKPLLTIANLWRFLGVSLLYFVVIILLPVTLIVDFTPRDTPDFRNAVASLAFVAMIPWSGLILSVFGTQLPAAAMGRPMSLRKTLRAARKTWWKVLLQLALIALPAMLALFWSLNQVAPPNEQNWPSPVIPFALSLVEFIVTSLPVVLSIGILCRAYEQGYPPESAEVTPVPQPEVAPAAAP
ncbi:hypothetical protein [Pararhodobacter zhoushanensis]|uniref:Uncharacterized protein n=1 Tax=Pararhodobacter zhoushanensis TaxID=2479545 RepID=A0ABT3GZQ0_9RHOB|nr:hypothetical protein [Pararhodobacter zhoushanensis]MCW1933006.1 hypothetical protein [Pararhodobacter zhoushanensis]